MSSEFQVEDLEKALIQRANNLAQELLQGAMRNHDDIIEDANERLLLREEKEMVAAKMLAKFEYRSRVQSSELKVQKKLDQLRWQLINNVIAQVKEKIYALVKNRQEYSELLVIFINASIKAIDNKDLIVELNEVDFQSIKTLWDKMLTQMDNKKNIQLSEYFHSMSGGVIVYNQTRTIRIDNTFEGRIERLSEEIYQRVSEQFFSELSHESDKIHGH